MRKAQIEETIKGILASELGVSAAVLAESDSHTPLLGRGIGLDSVEILALTVGLEEQFDIEIPDEHMTAELFHSIATLADDVHQALSRQGERET
jgi:acyl carrier protein